MIKPRRAKLHLEFWMRVVRTIAAFLTIVVNLFLIYKLHLLNGGQ